MIIISFVITIQLITTYNKNGNLTDSVLFEIRSTTLLW